MRRKHAKEAAERELEEFVNLLRSAKDMPRHAKPPKSMWSSEEKNHKKIEILQAYAIDDCRNEDDKKTAGMVNCFIFSSFSFYIILQDFPQGHCALNNLTVISIKKKIAFYIMLWWKLNIFQLL